MRTAAALPFSASVSRSAPALSHQETDRRLSAGARAHLIYRVSPDGVQRHAYEPLSSKSSCRGAKNHWQRRRWRAMLTRGTRSPSCRGCRGHTRIHLLSREEGAGQRRVSLLDVDASFTGRKQRGASMQFELGLAMPFTSLCPCSRRYLRMGRITNVP